jgi:signal transduction histidine kinase
MDPAFAHNGDMRMRVGSRWEVFFDVVAAVTLVAAVVGLVASPDGQVGLGPWSDLVLLLAGASLVAVRRWVPTSAAVGSIVTSGLVLLAPSSSLAVWVLAEICLFTLPLRRPRIRAVLLGAAHAALLYVGAMVAFQVGPLDPLALILPVWTGAVVAFGSALRSQQDYVDALEQRARTLAAARETEVRQRLSEERVRIARDLHDSVANSIAVITMNAAQAEIHLADDPARARTALATVRLTGKTTLNELGEILMVLRGDDPETDRTLATAEGLPHLIEVFTAGGMDVRAQLTELPAGTLDAAAGAALYRLAQEALTNARRHGSGPVLVETRLEPEAVVTRIENRIADDRNADGVGYGLIGMRERIERAGGRLDLTEGPEQFRLVARLPRVDRSRQVRR